MGTVPSFLKPGQRAESPTALGEDVRIRSMRLGVISGLVVLVMLVSTALSTPVTTNAKAQGTSTLRVGFLANIESLNPFTGINDADYFLYGLVYDYLFALDEDGNPLPDLAISAVNDTGGQNWTYTLRPGVLWHDGTPLTARDVAFSVNYQVGSGFVLWAYEPYLNRVVPCPNDLVEGGSSCGANVTDWTSPKPSHVTIHFDLPFVPGKSLYFPIIQWKQWCNAPDVRHCVVSPSAAQGGTGNPYQNLNPIGTGPFKADAGIGNDWVNGQPLLLHKNTNYHLYVPHVDDMYLVSGVSDVTLVQSLRTGDIDVAEVTPGGYDALAGISGVGRQEYLLSTQYWIEIGFQQRNAPNANNLNPARWDQNVRRALAMATNKDAIIRSDFLGKGDRGATLMSPISPYWWYNPATDPSVNLTYNVAAANALLDAAHYTAQCTGKPGIRAADRDIPVDANGVPGVVPVGTCLSFKGGVRQEYPQEQAAGRDIVTMWRQVGVEVTDRRRNPGTFEVMLESALEEATYTTQTIDVYIWYWSGDPDPNYLLSIESGYTLDGWNDNYWDNQSYNQLYVQHLAAFDPAQRAQIVRDAQEVHYKSAVYIILIYPYGEWAYREDKFEGWGDWTAHPYRQLNAFFTAPPLFRDLAPVQTSVPVPDVTLADSSGRPSQHVTISGTIQDTVAGTWQMDFGDSSPLGTGTYSAPGATVTQLHTYASEGLYTVRLTANNGQAETTAIGHVTITAVGNLAPDRVALGADVTSGLPGTRVNFTLSGHDEEGGTLTFRINYGDGTSDTRTETNVAANVTTTVTFSHVYPSAGSFIAKGNVSDGQASSSEARVTVTIRSPSPPPSGGVDTRIIGAGIAVALVAIAAVAVLMRRRARKKEETLGPPPPPK